MKYILTAKQKMRVLNGDYTERRKILLKCESFVPKHHIDINKLLDFRRTKGHDKTNLYAMLAKLIEECNEVIKDANEILAIPQKYENEDAVRAIMDKMRLEFFDTFNIQTGILDRFKLNWNKDVIEPGIMKVDWKYNETGEVKD